MNISIYIIITYYINLLLHNYKIKIILYLYPILEKYVNALIRKYKYNNLKV